MSRSNYLYDQEAWSVTPYDGVHECQLCGNHYQPAGPTQDICDECEDEDTINQLRQHRGDFLPPDY